MSMTKFDTKNAERPRAYEKRLTFADIPVCTRTNTSVSIRAGHSPLRPGNLAGNYHARRGRGLYAWGL